MTKILREMQVKKKGKTSMRKKNGIPKFKSYREEAKFWDTHDITDFESETKDVDIIFELDKPRDETLILRLQKEVKDRLEKTARLKGLNVSSLARMWLMEKLQSSRIQ
ncbi:hypothetical protein A2Z00_03895 [Candidatus Gottesmanbacteria bacterium RBG_13_45_10]|uniref:Uncharacterized protein n=1 Tax=Candidatus Gottesmanbacteria bacterium RBG_13_45_10 TaxID=1798370 RepID=A0A1F5ZHW6_9BACT|nr:MAG: hypothetical protein A2Z00_03895 [Candidatus Gottesmanbacteria bacterium RBG_13_45_10]